MVEAWTWLRRPTLWIVMAALSGCESSARVPPAPGHDAAATPAVATPIDATADVASAQADDSGADDGPSVEALFENDAPEADGGVSPDGVSSADGDWLDAPSDAPSDGGVDATADNAAEAAVDGGADADDSGGLTGTDQDLYDHAPSCLSCAEDSGALDPTGFGVTCEELGDGGAFQNCVATLRCILASDCETNGDPTRCLCGTVDIAQCSNDPGGTPPNGPCADDYYMGFGTMNVMLIYNSFFDSSNGPGAANALVSGLTGTCPTCF